VRKEGYYTQRLAFAITCPNIVACDLNNFYEQPTIKVNVLSFLKEEHMILTWRRDVFFVPVQSPPYNIAC
jgi:hypothetical protein